MTDHPLPPGTLVYHSAQEWARSIPGGTGEVIAVVQDRSGARYPAGSPEAYEYQVRTGRDFSRRPGADNPQDRLTRWAGWTVHRAAPTAEEHEGFEKLMASLRALTPEQRAEALRQANEAAEELEALTSLQALADGLLASETFRADFLQPDPE